MGGRGGTIGFQNTEFMNSALGKATVKAVDIIADVKRSTPSVRTASAQRQDRPEGKSWNGRCILLQELRLARF